MRRKAFTIVELMVVVAIVGVLSSILLPAVQAARETASRTRCANNLKQLSLAVHQYSDQNGCLAPGGLHRNDSTHWNTGVLLTILPFLERSTVFDGFNADCGVSENFDGPSTYASNATLIQTQLSVYICPSDGRVQPWTSASYVGNLGGPTQLGTYSGAVIPTHGLPGARSLQWSDFQDGASKTALWSECLIGKPNNKTVVAGMGGSAERRYYYDTQLHDFSQGPEAVNRLLEECRRVPAGQLGLGNRGVWWHVSHWYYAGYSFYNHVGPPNSRSCANDKVWSSWALDIWGSAPPSSLHPGGVNVAFADGSVRFASDNIDLAVWWAAGTRDGQETLSSPGL